MHPYTGCSWRLNQGSDEEPVHSRARKRQLHRQAASLLMIRMEISHTLFYLSCACPSRIQLYGAHSRSLRQALRSTIKSVSYTHL